MIYIKTVDAISAMKRLGVILSPKELQQAQSRAINRSLEKGRTIARTEVKQVYNISQRYLGGIAIERSTRITLTGALGADRKPIPIDAFAPKQETGGSVVRISKRGEVKVRELKRAKKNPTAGVSIEVKKGEREVIPFAFLIPTGKARVFARGSYRNGTGHGFVQRHERVNKEGSDTPVKPLITASVFGMIGNDIVINRIGNSVQSYYPDRLVREITFLADKAK